MMTSQQLAETLTDLNLSPDEAAQLLRVSARTVRRWIDGESIPGPAEAALRAWRHLEAHKLPWKPDSISVFQEDEHQIQRNRDHAELLVQLMSAVEARGGPANPWVVDLARQRATFGPAEVSFYRLQNGGFSPSTYRRLDRPPTKEDTSEIQDACFCIAQALSRARHVNRALIDIADYTREHASRFAQDGTTSLSPTEAARKTSKIAALADDLYVLAASALEGKALQTQFQTILRGLHHLGFFPDMGLVSAVAHSMADAPTARS